ncbi:MAG: AtpZ/AtpI family protein [Acidimicrobiales bacterium]
MSAAGDEGPRGDSDQGKSTIKNLPGVAAFATMGTTIAGCLAVGVVLGLWADHVWHSAPWGLLIGIVLGTVAAVTSVVKLVRRFL